ncbi:MAG: hypothetical protein V9E94_04695 [Microthrixaceae bacterium]
MGDPPTKKRKLSSSNQKGRVQIIKKENVPVVDNILPFVPQIIESGTVLDSLGALEAHGLKVSFLILYGKDICTCCKELLGLDKVPIEDLKHTLEEHFGCIIEAHCIRDIFEPLFSANPKFVGLDELFRLEQHVSVEISKGTLLNVKRGLISALDRIACEAISNYKSQIKVGMEIDIEPILQGCANLLKNILSNHFIISSPKRQCELRAIEEPNSLISKLEEYQYAPEPEMAMADIKKLLSILKSNYLKRKKKLSFEPMLQLIRTELCEAVILTNRFNKAVLEIGGIAHLAVSTLIAKDDFKKLVLSTNAVKEIKITLSGICYLDCDL